MHYFIASITIHDNDEYQKYLEGAAKVFSKYKGTYLTVDNNPKVLEGEWNCTRMVVISFPSEEDFSNWYYSDEYQQILKHRLNSADCNTLLAQGIN